MALQRASRGDPLHEGISNERSSEVTSGDHAREADGLFWTVKMVGIVLSTPPGHIFERDMGGARGPPVRSG